MNTAIHQLRLAIAVQNARLDTTPAVVLSTRNGAGVKFTFKFDAALRLGDTFLTDDGYVSTVVARTTFTETV